MLYYGMKYYKPIANEDGLPDIYRIVDIYKENGEDKYKLINTKDKKNSIKLTEKEIKNTFIKLSPDAMVSIFTTSMDKDDNEPTDFFITVNRYGIIDPTPVMVMRQNIISNTKSIFLNDSVYVGEVLTKNNVQKDESPIDLLEFKHIINHISIAAYLTDIDKDILYCIPSKNKNIFSNALKTIKSNFGSNAIEGFETKISDFMANNNFNFHFRDIFNIKTLDFEIYPKKDKDGNINLTNSQKKKLEDYLYKLIDIIAVLEYDRDIDVSKFMKVDHVVISDSKGTVYLIAYKKLADYKVDSDIELVFN